MIPDCSFEFSGREVHVWTLHIEASHAVATTFEPVLSADEKDRAAHFRFDHLRHSFVTVRGALRYLLGRYLDLHPARILFNYGLKGKPALASDASIEFNLTHSGDMAAFAFTVGCQIGVDVEQIRPLTEAQDIANRYFCSEESAEMMSLPPNERERAFFFCWTRKEAYIKAIGDGLSAPLHEFRVTLQPNEPARLIHLAHDKEAARAWTLHDLRLDSNYAAALAYRDRQRPLSIIPIVDPRELTGVL
jgi:4'-phosphopantetheinyl transferase